MKIGFLFILVVLGLSVVAQHIQYEFAAPNAIHHEAEISITVDGLPSGPAVFRMSRSSPGRYATHEFGKNVYNVKAYDEAGNLLPLEKTDADVYQVSNHKGTVKVSYTLYGDYPDGTYAGIDVTNYHLNMPAAFMWVKGLDEAPITIHFTIPDKDWKIATQLKPSGDPYTFSAPGLQYFMDSPTKIGRLHFREWKVVNPDKKEYTFRLALEADAPDALIDAFAQKLQQLVKEEQAVYGEVPSYDYGTYTFIASINPYVKGDGMEHRNSTMITIPATFTGGDNQLNVFAHEFFHCWNVKRIRPKSIEPFNFEKSNMCEALWVAEGFTQYYGILLMKRAGLSSGDAFNAQMSGLINAKLTTPGGQYYTPVENSQRAVFADAGVSIDRTNYPNMFTTYYYYGGALALALDLQLREQFNKSLDNFMHEMWIRFGKTEKAYTLPQMQETLAAVTNPTFAADFFNKYVYKSEAPAYAQLVQAAGLNLKRSAAGKAWIGNIFFSAGNDGLIVNNNTVRNTPLYEAGVDVGDVVIALDNKSLKQADDISGILLNHKPGETLKLTYKHHNQKLETAIKLQENPANVLVPSATINSTQQSFNNAWVSSHVNQRKEVGVGR